MRILIAPDKFKGSLTAEAVCRAVEDGIRQYDPSIETIRHPLADGGEGTLDALDACLDLKTVYLTVNDPLFRPLEAYYKIKDTTAYIEMAVASGLELLAPEERNCLYTTSLGTGELLQDAIRKGAQIIYLFIGGSATNDGGMGMAAALGYRFFDHTGQVLAPTGENLVHIKSMEADPLRFDPDALAVKVVCDVENVLFGPSGAAYVYGPQKGAGPEAVAQLDEGLRNFAAVVQKELGRDIAAIPGAGAAGGLGAGAMAFLGAVILPGIRTIMEITGFPEKLTEIDLIITGEGKLDEQTLKGKVVKGVCEVGRASKIPVMAICGSLSLGPEQIKQLGLEQVHPLKTPEVTLEQAIREAGPLVTRRTLALLQHSNKTINP